MPRKALLLLARLRLSDGGAISRDDAADFLWTVDDHALALTNLRKMLSRVQTMQSELASAFVVADGRRLKLADGAFTSDLDAFDDTEVGASTLVELCDRGFLREACDGIGVIERWAESQRLRQLAIIRTRLLNAASVAGMDFLSLRKAAYFLLDRFPDDNEVRDLVTGAAGSPPSPPAKIELSVPAAPREAAPAALSRQAMSFAGPRVALLPPAGHPAADRDFNLSTALVDDVAICLCALRAFAMVAPYTAERIRGSHDKAGLLAKHDITYVIDTRLSQQSLVMQIIFVPSDSIIFAERYDISEANLAHSRRGLAEAISSTILSTLSRNEAARVDYELNPQAYRRYLMGVQQMNRLTLPSIRAARRTFRDTLKEREDFAFAYGGLARTFTSEWILTARGDTELLRKAEEAAIAAIAHGPEIASSHKELGRVRLYLGQLDESLEALENAERLSPHYADAISTHADTLVHASRPREGLEKIERAIALNPLGPDEYFWSAAGASFFLEDYETCIAYVQRMGDASCAYRLLAAALAMSGDKQKAHQYRRKDMQENPQFSLTQWLAVVPIRESWQKDLYREGLTKAGYEN
ncbi:tetratricopeptide repeat protein [Rhizobium sp. RU20A]|uniref:tetratricopeptide repeat protein n=1 Tax=Rhizobium sp. RU20A TaxID=1907412 RepID=UPI00122CB521|nr:tetratricopeptide repeat protein [Rhizobium sp. RU20A]